MSSPHEEVHISNLQTAQSQSTNFLNFPWPFTAPKYKDDSLLVHSSGFYKALLGPGSNWRENDDGIVRHDEIGRDVLLKILTFIYGGSIEVKSTEVARLLQVADYLDMPLIVKTLYDMPGDSN
jgi:hypothetical protein